MERDFLTPLFFDLRDSRQWSAWLPLRCIAALQSFVPAQSRLPGSTACGTFGAAGGGLSCAVHPNIDLCGAKGLFLFRLADLSSEVKEKSGGEVLLFSSGFYLHAQYLR